MFSMMNNDNNHNYFMKQALEEAKISFSEGEVPVGAVSVLNNKILVRSGNKMQKSKNPINHAEIIVLYRSAKILAELGKSVRYEKLDLYVTLEPCAMCAQAISLMRINNLFYGAEEPKGGSIKHGAKIFEQKTCHHKPKIYSNILSRDSEKLLKEFFKILRKK